MNDHDFLAGRFEEHRARLRAVAYRMLGSLSEADDAVQEAWLRLSRSGADGVDNLAGWLTTVVGRICIDMLRSRQARREDGVGVHLPDPVVSLADGGDPEHEALVADSVGLALLVVLQSLAPAERLAFVLHDMFGVPFEEIGPLVERTPAAARKLASRARRRVRGTAPRPDPDLARQRRVVEAFQAAARDGDFEALVAVLHPDVVARADLGAPGGVTEVRGAANVAKGALIYRRPGQTGRHVLVNGSAGFVNLVDGRAVSLHSFTIVGGLVTAIDVLADPERLEALDLAGLIG
ncbi:sigma-70 family RNA polymerase sigma factor [Nonomuraea roseoviolacea]|uniref:RNA polymerase sigma-70 factor (ECF subfamily) n=1 Tax=Nonomuraea roseoviolacea subsp. carminata TaxID=160689 RepID=A0ABT1KAL8_9ACTN|nr:sigma-70 family RNA polymerase sigma factor [Nonomuraea roseoviolacea]MCP2351063.1 RNA polymerase sigma-70 factor (ECF subfamily) [Nonomuraea roseoviolacea subsp. carminata]